MINAFISLLPKNDKIVIKHHSRKIIFLCLQIDVNYEVRLRRLIIHEIIRIESVEVMHEIHA